MEEFILVSEDELREVNGRGGGGGSRSSSNSGSKPSTPPAPKPNPAPSPVTSSLETNRINAAVTAKEVATANALVAAKLPYGANGNVTGKVSPTTLSSYDCSGAMSAVTGRPYQSTASLMSPAVQASNGYVKAVSNTQAGTWTVVQYKDPASGTTVGHAQMTMGGGQYFDSVNAENRNGPSLSPVSTLDYLKNKGIQPSSVVYLRPGQ